MAPVAMAAVAPTASGVTTSQQPAASPSISELPFKREPVAGASAVEPFAWAMMILAILGVAIFIVVRRRMSPAFNASAPRWMREARAGSSVRVLGRTSLGPQATLHTVEWHGEELLLACTAHNVTLITSHLTVGPKAGA